MLLPLRYKCRNLWVEDPKSYTSVVAGTICAPVVYPSVIPYPDIVVGLPERLLNAPSKASVIP